LKKEEAAQKDDEIENEEEVCQAERKEEAEAYHEQMKAETTAYKKQ
jgi:hypothetical protein